MDWQIKPLARKSAVSDDNFEIGERVVCLVYLNDASELTRDDVRVSELEAYTMPDKLLGRWERIVKREGEEERAAQRQAMATAEGLFLALFENEDGVGAQDVIVTDALKQVLALMLERKRILKRKGSLSEGKQCYRYVKTGQELEVPMDDIDPSTLVTIQEQLDGLV